MYANPDVRFRGSALTENQLNSLDVVTNRLFMKLFRTRHSNYLSIQELLNFELPSVQLEASCKKFVNKFSAWCSI